MKNKMTFPYPEKKTHTAEEIQKIIEQKQAESGKMTFPLKNNIKKETN